MFDESVQFNTTHQPDVAVVVSNVETDTDDVDVVNVGDGVIDVTNEEQQTKYILCFIMFEISVIYNIPLFTSSSLLSACLLSSKLKISFICFVCSKNLESIDNSLFDTRSVQEI